MEIKIVISVDDRTAGLITALVAAMSRAKPAVIEPEHHAEPKLAPVSVPGEPKPVESAPAPIPEAKPEPKPVAKAVESAMTDADFRAFITVARKEHGSAPIMAIIKAHGAQTVSALDPNEYPAVKKEVEALKNA